MPQFDAETLQRMRERAKVTKARMMGSGGDFSRYASLSGKNAIVAPGEAVVVRLLPKWDFAAQRYMKDKAGKVVENPKYRREPCWFGGWEHWFDNKDGKRQRLWCRRNLGEAEPCPLCDAAAALRGGSEEERTQGRSMDQKEIYLYNIILRAAPFAEDGKPDIRILTAPATVYTKISDLCTGADEAQQQFALGDVSDPWDGYDLQIVRPAGQGDRYDVKAATKPSRLFEKEDAAKWSGWQTRLYDLEKDIFDNIPSVEEMEKALYGESRSGGRAASSAADPSDAPDLPGGDGAAPEAPEEAPAGGGGDFDFPDAGGEEPPPPVAKSPAPPRRAPAPGRRR